MALTWRVFRTEARWRMAIAPSHLWNAEDRWCWEVWEGEALPAQMFVSHYDDGYERLRQRGYGATRRIATKRATVAASSNS